ncbi:protein YLS3-like [Durio zibethinus]|uniref:Protein YLS3-like n=1 Tax=Durio zibethinus TaxID=66656 RepID=A0A6P5Y9R2_DURZI|nr:protein YLS3-like [Durio zibethinus]
MSALTYSKDTCHYLSKDIAVRLGEKTQKRTEIPNAMAKMLIVAVLVILGTMATVTDAQATCAQQLVPCAPYLNNATAQPGDDCCNPIRQAVATELSCLCNLYNDPSLLASFNITVAAALRISRECGITTNLSACNATSPTSAPPPPGQPGAAERIALTGLTAMFLFLVSIALY